MESNWNNILRNGGSVEVNIQPIYLGNSKRPDYFAVIQKINGKIDKQVLKNTPTWD